MSEKKRTFNPIDPDKIAEDANILPYGSSVSAPAFKAVDVLKNKMTYVMHILFTC